MAPNGTFAVAWDQITAQTSGVVTDSQIMAKYFYNDGTEIAPEFVADSGVGTGGGDIYRTARNPQLDLDENGNMTVVWESFGPDDNGPDSYGIFFSSSAADHSDRPIPLTATVTICRQRIDQPVRFRRTTVNPESASTTATTVVWMARR